MKPTNKIDGVSLVKDIEVPKGFRVTEIIDGDKVEFIIEESYFGIWFGLNCLGGIGSAYRYSELSMVKMELLCFSKKPDKTPKVVKIRNSGGHSISVFYLLFAIFMLLLAVAVNFFNI